MSAEDTAQPTEDTTEPAQPERPVLRIVSPDATAEEIAALVAVLGALGAAGPPASRRTAEWSQPSRAHRPPVFPGRSGWRSSSLPG